MHNSSFIVGDNFNLTREDFEVEKQKLNQLIDTRKRIAVYSQDPKTIVLAILSLKDSDIELFLFHTSFSESFVKSFIAEHGIYQLIRSWNGEPQIEYYDSAREKLQSALYIFSSGTTGEPKVAKHSWEAISAAAKHVNKRLHYKNWLMAYNPTGYAGLQVLLAATENFGGIYLAPNSFEETARGIIKNDVTVISATPTYWKLLISSWPKSLLMPQLEQATLGGEVVTQDVIDLIDNKFIPKGLAHVYASTEAGSAFSVSDRKEGFPKSLLEKSGQIKMRVRDNCLEILSERKMLGYENNVTSVIEDNWVKTGDRLRIDGDRVYFSGREDGRINLGGMKVFPEEVEAEINKLEEIKDCIVYEKSNPIVGSLLVADIVLTDPDDLNLPKIKKKLREELEAYKVPRVLNIVPKIEVNENGKKIRRK